MEDKRYPSHTQDKFQLRFPDGMRDRIREVAEANGRSMNTEIVQRLAFTLEIEDSLPVWEENYGVPTAGGSYDSLIPLFERLAERTAEIEALGMGGISVDDRLKQIQQDISEMKQLLKSK